MTLQTVREDSIQALGTLPDRTGTHLADMVDDAERIDPAIGIRQAEASSSKGRSTSAKAPNPTRFGFRRSVVANWRELLPGDTVVLVGSSNDRVSGTADAVTTDGDMMWILQDNGAGRKLFHNSDSYQTLTDPKAF